MAAPRVREVGFASETSGGGGGARISQAVFDIACFCICLPSLLMPTRMYAFVCSLWYGVGQLRLKGNENRDCPANCCTCCDSDDEGFDERTQTLQTNMRLVWLALTAKGQLSGTPFEEKSAHSP